MNAPAMMLTVEATRPNTIKREMAALPASRAMTFECHDCRRERFNPYEIPLGTAVMAGPGNVVSCACGDGCIERCAR